MVRPPHGRSSAKKANSWLAQLLEFGVTLVSLGFSFLLTMREDFRQCPNRGMRYAGAMIVTVCGLSHVATIMAFVSHIITIWRGGHVDLPSLPFWFFGATACLLLLGLTLGVADALINRQNDDPAPDWVDLDGESEDDSLEADLGEDALARANERLVQAAQRLLGARKSLEAIQESAKELRQHLDDGKLAEARTVLTKITKGLSTLKAAHTKLANLLPAGPPSHE